ncbi:vWA domain-containing protein [Microbulbifer aggregans]|uniref:vWA domain-containing protein n=1 Tax=Microbulbifer aggregans TaxID=1769779 RepID=UPI001CFE7FF7|nr:von Willebrand factor type A domain-containing protein [Microbulbifer aggregans]
MKRHVLGAYILSLVVLVIGSHYLFMATVEQETGASRAIEVQEKKALIDARRAREAGRQAKMVAPAMEARPIISPPRIERFSENTIKRVSKAPVSTFSADVDTASYSFARRMLLEGHPMWTTGIRLEEWLNYFDYDYPVPSDPARPFTTHVTVTDSPWKSGNKVLHIGIQGYKPEITSRPRSNLVFLLDISGSMKSQDRLPLIKRALRMMLDEMHPQDSVAIVTYAGASGIALPPTNVAKKSEILRALDNLEAAGSTAGSEGIQLAYQLAEEHFDNEAVNRVLLASDGDFNIGVTDRGGLEALISRKREKGIYLSVLGVGLGNYDDQLMQTLAQKGNGVAAYIGDIDEARKVLMNEAYSALFPIAEDVKFQVEFNPATVLEYRLLGYETRALAREDFNNDKVDAAEVGAGHSVTAIYEITPVGGTPLVESSRYSPKTNADADSRDEYAFVRLRYKLPGKKRSQLEEVPVPAHNTAQAEDWQQREVAFATAVAGAAQLLRKSKYTGDWTLDDAIALAQANRGQDPYGYRVNFVEFLRLAKSELH